MTYMEINIHSSMLPHDEPSASLVFYRDTLGFEIRNDVGCGGRHWITGGPHGQSDIDFGLHQPSSAPGITEDDRRTIGNMMAKRTYASINLEPTGIDRVFERLQAGDADVVQEPTDQPYGVRDCAFRDPPGNLVRIQELR